MMYIDDYSLRASLRELLKTRTRARVTRDIQATGVTLHQYNIDKLLSGKDVSLSTLKKLDKYLYQQQLNNAL